MQETLKKIRHKKYNLLKQVLTQGDNVMLVGPAGSGKTTAVEHLAHEMGREFYCISVGAQTSKSDLMGYMDATGSYRSTVFRKAYQSGGIFLLDEIDAGNANVLTCLNAALANNVCSFPDGMITKHLNFGCVASGNTYGLGANRQYIGRNQLDAASLDRFAMIEWEYDEVLETKLGPNKNWTIYVQKIRKAVDALKVKLVVSPRASIEGGKLINIKMDVDKVLDIRIFKGLVDELTKQKILNYVGKPPKMMVPELPQAGCEDKSDQQDKNNDQDDKDKKKKRNDQEQDQKDSSNTEKGNKSEENKSQEIQTGDVLKTEARKSVTWKIEVRPGAEISGDTTPIPRRTDPRTKKHRKHNLSPAGRAKLREVGRRLAARNRRAK